MNNWKCLVILNLVPRRESKESLNVFHEEFYTNMFSIKEVYLLAILKAW
jgi:hypothetical protein